MTKRNDSKQGVHPMPMFGAVILIALVATGCSASTSVDSVVAAAPTVAATSETDTSSVDEPTPPANDDSVSTDEPASADETLADDPAAAEPDGATVAPTASWDGPDVAPLLDARMAELAAPFGSLFSPEAVAAIFETPADFPYPQGTITGVMHTWDVDQRVTDKIDIEEERIIGLEGDPSDTVLDAISDSLEADPDSRWGRSSAQRQEGQAWNDLFTAEDGDGDGVKDRLVLASDIDPDDGESDLKISVEFEPGEIPEQGWMAGLPIPAGGQLVGVLEGMGLVKDFGTIGGNGTITARWSYPVDAVPDLVEFLNSGVVGAAGFEHEDLSVTADDPTDRFDVSIGDWEGQLIVSTFSVGDANPAGYHVMWTLNRA